MTSMILRLSSFVGLAVLLAMCERAEAQGPTGGGTQVGSVHTLGGAGVTMTVDTRRLLGPGYRPVQVTLVPGTPAIGDRTFTFEFMVGNTWEHRGTYDTKVVEQIVLPGGAPMVKQTISVPGANFVSAYRFDVREGGDLILPLSIDWIQEAMGSGQRPDEALPRILFVGNALPDTSNMGQAFPMYNAYTGYQRMPVPGGGMGPASIAPISPPAPPLASTMSKPAADLSDRWVDYTGFDLIALSLDDLASLRQQQPGAFRAILAWTGAGGNLMVWGIGDKWNGLNRLELLTGLSSPLSSSADWTEPNASLRNRPLTLDNPGAIVYNNGVGIQEYSTDVKLITPAPKPPSGPNKPAHFRLCSYQLGMIAALAPANPFDGNAQPRNPKTTDTPGDWQFFFNALGPDRFLWSQRHGMSTMNDNPDFWKFLIPGVGLAPVGTFQILITLFVLAIGPANYYLLKRRKQLHLMIVTVPVAAAAVTLLLFVYAIFADGFDTRVRMRSVTVIDQPRGEAVCWSRLSYYAGVSPSDGLRYPTDAAVYAMEPVPGERPSFGRDVRWGADQHFARGWIPSRTPLQYLTIRSRPTEAKLVVRENDGQVSVENRLGTRINRLIVRTKSGKYYSAMNVAPDATAACEPADAAQESIQWTRLYAENLPVPFSGLSPWQMQQYRSDVFQRRRRVLGWASFERPNNVQESSRLEQGMTGLFQTPPGSPEPLGLEGRSYAAIVDRSPEVVPGTAVDREEKSFHMILGSW